MKKIVAIVMTMLLILFSLTAVSADDGIKVYFDGELLNFDVQPVIQDGRTLVPMRVIFEKLGAEIEWNESTKTIKATSDMPGITRIISITIGNKTMTSYTKFKLYEDDETTNHEMDVPAQIIGGRTFIPLRAVSEAFYCEVGWDGKYKTVSIIFNSTDLQMLYAPEGRSKAFSRNEVCGLLENGWFEYSDLTNYSIHLDLDSNYICPRCGKSVPPKLNMTKDDIKNANNVEYISNREIWHNDNDKQFIFTFSFWDSTQKNELSCPAIVRMWIDNDDGVTVYDRTITVSNDDFGTWTKTLTGAQTYRCGIYINDYLIDSGTSKSGTFYYNILNDGYFDFDVYSLRISDNLPLLYSFIELPELPRNVSEYGYDGKVTASYTITEMDYEIDDDDLTIIFSGEKTYDKEGNNYGRSCHVNWKLYDSEGYVVESGTLYTPNITVGEKFRNEKTYAYGCIKPGEDYTLKITNVDN